MHTHEAARAPSPASRTRVFGRAARDTSPPVAARATPVDARAPRPSGHAERTPSPPRGSTLRARRRYEDADAVDAADQGVTGSVTSPSAGARGSSSRGGCGDGGRYDEGGSDSMRWMWSVLLLEIVVVFVLLLVPRQGRAGFVRRMDAYVDGVVSDAEVGTPGFAVVLGRHGEAVYRGARGAANVELRVPMAVDARFRLASVTKQFASVAVMMLVEDGVLALEDAVLHVLSGYDVRDARLRNVSVWNLMTHTSGVPHWRPWMLKSVGMDHSDFESLVRGIMAEELLFDPGTKFAYSSAGYQLLGAVIEEVAGMSLENFLEKRVFRKVGMPSTSFDDPGRLIPLRVQGYTRFVDEKMTVGDQLLNANHLVNASRRHAAGALISTVDDLLRWDTALHLTNTLLNSTSMNKLHERYELPDGSYTECSSGFFHGKLHDVPIVRHAGSHPGFTSHIISGRILGIYVAVLANTDDAAIVDVDMVAERFFDFAMEQLSTIS